MLQGKHADDLYDVYRHVREVAPFAKVGNIWAATRFDDCMQIARDRHLGKETGAMNEAFEGIDLPVRPAVDVRQIPSLLFLNPPEHTRIRGMVMKAFTPQTVERLRDWTAAHLDGLLDEIPDGAPIDVMTSFAFRLPIDLIGELIGVPESDRPRFLELVPAGSKWFELNATAEEVEEARRAAVESVTYFGDLVRQRRAQAADDLLSELIHVREGDDRLPRREVIITAMLIFSAGFETTMNLIANTLVLLARHPEQLALLREQPDLMTGTVEEVLRFEPTAQLLSRYVLEPTEIAGHRLEPGEWVVGFVGAANRDPDVFDDPDRFDIRRRSNQHLSFSIGPHHCLGAAVARMELAVVLERVLARYDQIELVDPDPPWRPGIIVRGPNAWRCRSLENVESAENLQSTRSSVRSAAGG